MRYVPDMSPEDIPEDSVIFIVIDNRVYELETAEDQELFGMFE